MEDPERIGMDVRLRAARQQPPVMPGSAPVQTNGRGLAPEQIAQILGAHQQRELLVARGFSECRGLRPDQLEDLYQETTLALLHRPYRDEKHLRDALRRGIKQRALNLYRDERRHQEILASNAPGLHALERARSGENDPEQVALARQDRLIITEFLTELTPQERRVFCLSTEGMRYNRIAKILGIPVNEARNSVTSCERKRERFQLLYEGGRLCGYRSATIQGLLEGQATSEQLARLALAHIESCAHCRQEHHTNTQQLRRAFQDQAAALLPPMLLRELGHLARASNHARILAHRLQPGWSPFAPPSGGGGEGVRERVVAVLAGSGATAKIAAGVITAAVIAGGTLTATHALEHHHTNRLRSSTVTHSGASPRATEFAGFTTPALAPPIRASARRTVSHHASSQHPQSPGHVVRIARARASHGTEARREPGGFAYLGVPTGTSPPTPAPAPTPASVPAGEPARTPAQTGGPFSP